MNGDERFVPLEVRQVKSFYSPLSPIYSLFAKRMEDNGLEHTPVIHGNHGFSETRVLNPTRADCESIETVFQLLPELDSEQLQTLATIARQFAPKKRRLKAETNAEIQR
ncbi:MAG: hypothetical protein ACOYKN_17645 [Pirellula sp.]